MLPPVLKVILSAILITSFISKGLKGDTVWNDSRDRPENTTVDCCHPWFVKHGDKCRCGHSLGGNVLCREDPPIVDVLVGYCMTFDETTNTTLAGACPYSFIRENKASVFLNIPSNVSELNEFMCGPVHRQGLLCGECKEGYYPAVYSYDYACTRCGSNSNWLVFLSVTLLPTTILFMLLILFQVNVNAPPFSALILFSQIVSSPEIVRVVPSVVNTTPNAGFPFLVLAQLILASHGIWSLEFFPLLTLPPSCLPGVTTALYTIALEYVIAFYPLVLVVVAYICIKLHFHNFKPFVILWRPFHRCFVRLRRSWNATASIINSFTTFLLLSYWKITYTSFNLLLITSVYTASGKRVGSRRFYYDASIDYFHGEHLSFAIVALLCIATFVVLPPLILCFYPLRTFKRIFSTVGIRGHSLNAFMDLFQGHYNNGSDGKRDWRWFSGVYFLIRIIILAVRINVSRARAYPILFLLLLTVSLLVSMMRPYRAVRYNRLDSSLLALLALFHFSLLWDHWEILSTHSLSVWLFACNYLVAFIPLLIYATLIVWGVSRCCKPKQRLGALYKAIAARCGFSHSLSTEMSDNVGIIDVDETDSFGDHSSTEYT